MALPAPPVPPARAAASSTVASRWDATMLPNYPTPELELVAGQGAHVTAADGRTYLDLLAGIAVNVLGHAHPKVVAAVRDQVGRLAHTTNLYAHPQALRLASRLQALAGGHRVLFVNSGTEANEAALKLCRKAANDAGRGDAVVVAFEGSFHGRTMGSLGLTGQPHHRKGFDPFPGQVLHVPFNDVAALEAAFDASDVAGVFVECVQGEGGLTPLSKDAAAALGRRCGAPKGAGGAGTGALLVVDEVQTGVARTGRFFAYEHHGLRPDAITMAKGLGGGLPLGALLVAPHHANVMGPGSHGCTFGGNAVACAAGNAVLDVIEGERLAERAARLGAAFAGRMAQHGVPVRGAGLLMGVPLRGPHAPAVRRALQGQAILVGQAGPDVVRLAPPLVVDEGDLLDAAAPIAAAVRAGASKP